MAVWLLWAVVTASVAFAEDPERLLHEHVAEQPELRAAEAGARAAASQADAVGLWSDPMLSVELSSLPIDSLWLTHPMAGVQFRAQQTLPVPGALGATHAVAVASAREAQARADEARARVEAAMVDAYWRVGLAERLLELTTAHRDRAQELLVAVTGRYEVGQAQQSHVLRLQLLHDRLDDEVIELQSAVAQRRAELVGVGGDSIPGLTWAKSVAPLSAPGALNDWIAAGHAHNHAVAALVSRQAQADAKDRLAGSELLPPVTLWAAYRVRRELLPQDVGRDFVSFGFSAPIPVTGPTRARAKRDAADAGQQQAGDAVDDALRDLDAELTGVHLRWARASERALRYDGSLRPLAEQALTAALSSFQAGAGDFASLYDAEVALLDVDRALAVATYQTYLLRSRARVLVGGELPSAATPR